MTYKVQVENKSGFEHYIINVNSIEDVWKFMKRVKAKVLRIEKEN